MGEGIGTRVANSMPEGLKQVELAARVGMTPDALSRSLSGTRGFSSIEIAKVAEELDVDLHWLITGEPDPRRIVVAARHFFDVATKDRSVPGWKSDTEILEDIALVYRQAEPALPATSDTRLPDTPAAFRESLGEGFVRPLADRIEADLSIDVVRLAGLSTAYSFLVGSRRVIALPAKGNWFWENWSLVHEYCHLARNHHDAGHAPEAEANAFAAEVLLPADAMRAIDWTVVGPEDLAQKIWDWGVSTDALSRRLQALSLPRSPHLDALLGKTTQALLRHHWRQPEGEAGDAITLRMDAAASRRFPLALQEGHLDLIARGKLDKASLAWMLAIDPEALEVELPPATEVPAEDLLDVLGLGRVPH